MPPESSRLSIALFPPASRRAAFPGLHGLTDRLQFLFARRLAVVLITPLLMTALWGLVSQSVILVARRPPLPSVGTVDYTPLLHQPIPDFLALGFACTNNDISDSGICTYHHDTGLIERIAVRVSRGTAQHIDLVPRSGTLLLGDLVALWGRPVIRIRSYLLSFAWPDQQVEAVSLVAPQRVSYRMQIFRITFGTGITYGAGIE